MSSLRAGMLLVATPLLDDPNFASTVVLLLDAAPPGPAVGDASSGGAGGQAGGEGSDASGLGVAGDDGGAVGIVLNRPSGVPVGEVLGPWGGLVDEPEVLHQGGPVGPDGALALALLQPGVEAPVGFRPLVSATDPDQPAGLDRLGVVDLDTPVELVGDALAGLRIYAGYAGWGAGQLEREIAGGHWYVVPGEQADCFRADVSGLWRDVLRRQPGDLAWHSTRPVDVGLN